MSVQEKLRAHIAETKGSNIANVAKGIGVPRQTLSEWMRGTYKGAATKQSEIELKVAEYLEKHRSPVVERLRVFLAANPQITKTSVAEDNGMSGSVISQYLAGKYKGDVGAVDEAVDAWLDRYKDRAMADPFEFRFVDTSVARQITALCRMAHNDRKFCVVTSDSGLGKTEACRAYARRNKGTVLIETDPTYNMVVLLSALHKALGFSGRGVPHHMFNECVEKLARARRLIIIDEAERLNFNALELARRLHDKARCGLVMAGMPPLTANLRGQHGQYAQLSTRVGGNLVLKGLTADDVRGIVEAYLPTANGLAAVFGEMTQNNARHLSLLIYNVLRIAQTRNEPVSEKLVRQTADVLLD